MQSDLEIEAADSIININGFKGSFDPNCSNCLVFAGGMFKEIDITVYGGKTEIALSSLASRYDYYELKGSGETVINMSAGGKGKFLNLDAKEFSGTLKIRRKQ